MSGSFEQSTPLRVLIIGFGNPGRCDDGLGPALAAEVDALHLPGFTVESNYQLCVEDAGQVAEHDVAVFADASVDALEPFEFRELHSTRTDATFTTHSTSPEAVAGLAHELYGADTRAYVLAIRGYRFNEFDESLSDPAVENLRAAVKFIRESLGTGTTTLEPTDRTVRAVLS